MSKTSRKSAPKTTKAAASRRTPATTKSGAGKATKKGASRAAKGGAAARPAAKNTKAKAADGYKIKPGDALPDFELPATGGGTVGKADLRGKRAVLYFYPKDNTPGCTLEGHDFRRLHGEFKKLGAVIYGISRDSLRTHESFKEKCGFPFELLTDSEDVLMRALDVIQMKSLYGRKFEGIERSTFVVDEKGVIRGVWRKVKVNGHADAVLAFVKDGMK